jgi:alpha-L-fucosidase 2
MKQILLFLFIVLPAPFVTAQGSGSVAAYDVVWNSLGTNESSSMPLGNGDIALNIWTEQSGDIVLLIAKSDAWSENGQLLKLGRVRISLTPNPFINSASFTQTLRLETGEVELRAGKNVVRIWVDANYPVVRLEAQTKSPVTMKAVSEIWRNTEYHLDQKIILEVGGRGGNFWDWKSKPDGLTFDPDAILPAENNRVSWCHFNKRSLYPLTLEQEQLESLLSKYPDPLLHRCFGVTMKGKFLISADNQTLKSSSASRSQQLDIYALTGQTDSPGSWRANLDQKIAAIDAVKRSSARKAHEQWWTQFWNKSWINIAGTPDASKVSQSYAMQRYMTACAGRGAQPIKFNGSLFTVGHDLPTGTAFSEANHDPDYRAWGASYWNQNTRHIYWPLLASGDYDMLAPWFNMYVKALPLVEDRSRKYFHHGGAAFIETINFWGLPNVNDYGWDNPGPELRSPWMRYHIQGGLEVLAQMMDRYDYTQNADFAKNTLLPMADGVITFYDQHWQRGADGKILMSPSQSIETYQENAVNPTPDIAGLKYILPRLLALPTGLSSAEQRHLWAKVMNDLPAIPIGTTANGKLPRRGQGDPNGLPTILPAEKYGASKNSENPELYAVFPYPIYAIGKPDLQLARNTYNARLYPFNKCWGQDGMHAALLGLTDDAEKAAIAAFTSYGDQSFPWFWSKNNDWIPDMDNGGGGMTTLQLMLMQCDGQRIQLLPAWPKNWTTDFKLNAPYQTTVEGHIKDGKITKLKVTPEGRAKDVIIVAP